jgi:hypothetical protein
LILKGYRWFSLVGFALGLLLLPGFFAGCGSNYSAQGGQPQATATTPPKPQNCGSVHTIHLLVVPTDQSKAKQIENCFWQAYQQCRPATLMFSSSEVDTGVIHNFSLKSANGACVISDGVQHFIAPRSPGAAKMYTCSSMAMQTDGLHILSCGELGNIVIPVAGTQ